MSATAKPKVNKADYMFTDKTGETLIKEPGQLNGYDFMIKGLKDCTVCIFDRTAQVGASSLLYLDYDRQVL